MLKCRWFSCKLSYWIVLAVALIPGVAGAQATNASLTGTYTFVIGSGADYSVQYNMFGQEVGFCEGSGQIPYGYWCQDSSKGQDVITGTLVADGNGNIISGSNYTVTTDPNKYQCSPEYNSAPDCPYQVPAGTLWSNSTSYVVGDEIDYVVNGKTLTYQAVKNSTDVTPSGTNVCTAKTAVKNPVGCTWDELYQSANGSTDGGSGTLAGTYSVQSNGLATLQLTPSGGKNQSVVFTMVVPAVSAVGQEVPLVAAPQLGNENRGGGTAVRIQ